MAELNKPTPPAHLTKPAKARWQKLWDEAHTQAKQDTPDDARAQHTTATKEANKMLRITPPADHAEAAALVEAFDAKSEHGWKVLAHGLRQVDGESHLYLVTADAKKHLFPIPSTEEVSSSKGKKKTEPAA